MIVARDRLAFAADRRKVLQESRALLARNPVFLDTETTGLHSTDQILEICVLDLVGHVLLDTPVRPSVEISPEAQAVHGLSAEMLADAPIWEHVRPELERVTQGRLIVIYNAAFDARMIDQSDRAAEVEKTPALEVWCLMTAVAVWNGEPSIRGGGYRWLKLNDAAERLGVEVAGPRHRARGDAETARRVLLTLASERDLGEKRWANWRFGHAYYD